MLQPALLPVSEVASYFLGELLAESAVPILLVDDDPLQLRVREAVLRRAHFEVAVATSAEGALAVLRAAARPFAAIITDHVLPGASGVEFVRRLRAIEPWVPVIVVTGMPEAEPEYKGLNILFQEKPVDPEEMIRLVERVTGRK